MKIWDKPDSRNLLIKVDGRMKKIQAVFEPAEEGGFTVYVPSLPGCISEGDTFEEAVENIKEAVELYLETDDKNVNRLN